MTALAILGLLFVLLAIGTPVGFAMAFAGCVGLLVTGGSAALFGILETTPLSTVSSYELITIPMFLLMADMVLLSGVADDLFKTASAWVGRIPGGLGMATALAGAGFGAICGTSTASAATLSSTSLPAMIRQGYEPKMAAGVVAISGTLAMLLPTSVALVMFGLLAEVNIGKLLISGIIPAILVTATIMATIYLLVWLDPARAPRGAPVRWSERFRLLWQVEPDGGAVRRRHRRDLSRHRHADRSLCVRRLRRAAAGCGQAQADPRLALQDFAARHPRHLHDRHDPARRQHLRLFLHADATSPRIWSPGWARCRCRAGSSSRCCCAGYIVLGSFMDQIAILVLTVPIVLPLIKSLGFDPIWFGVIKIVTAEVGMITPPIGLNCFIVARYAGRPVGEVFQGTFPHFIAHLIAIAILVAFPQIILWLPSQMAGH